MRRDRDSALALASAQPSRRLAVSPAGETSLRRSNPNASKAVRSLLFLAHFVHCGEIGIRTLETREGLTVFKTVPFDHSGISPFIIYFSNFKKYSLGFNSRFTILPQPGKASDSRFIFPLSINSGSTILDLQNICAS